MLFDLLERQATDRPQHPALVCGGEVHDWAGLCEQARNLAGGFAGLGIGPGTVVAALLPRTPEFFTSLFALARLGAEVLLLPTDLKAPEARTVLQAAGSRTLLSADAHPVSRELAATGAVERVFEVDGEGFGSPSLRRLARTASAIRPPEVSGSSPFLQLLTSGTTGVPKRIIRSQEALTALAVAYGAATQMSPRDRILGVIPLYHGHGLCNAVLAPLWSGATLLLEPGFERRRTLDMLSCEGVTMVTGPPFLYSALARSTLPAGFTCPSLRFALTAGAPLDAVTWALVRDRLGFPLRQFYGASETGVVAMNLDPDPEPTLTSCGHPIGRAEVAVRDASGQTLPAGQEGEITVRSPGAAGWWAPLAPGPLTCLPDSDGWIAMSDRGHLDHAGRLYITGRTSVFLNLAGRRVNPAEIEAALLDHPLVTAAQIHAIEDGFGNEAAKAVVHCSDACDPAELIAWCRQKLAGFKVPRLIEVRAGVRAK